MEIFDNLDPLLRTFWYVAIPTSVIFIIQTILTFIGAEAADGLETDINADLSPDDPMQLFSLRNLINFLLGFSWAGISLFELIPNKTILIVVALAVGVSFVYLYLIIIKQVQKLAEDNSFKINHTLNKSADVYLTIPEHKTGKGKIMISVNGSYHELEAMTENEQILSGSTVKVVKIESNNVLIVEAI